MAPHKVLPRFNPPGYLDDLKSDKDKQEWSDTVSGWMQEEIDCPPPNERNRTKLPQFFNGTQTPFDQEQAHTNVRWIGFPKKVTGRSDEDRWQKADADRDLHDEYLEWSVYRKDGNIISVTYTCEGPEYWEFLSLKQPDETVALIKKLNAPLLDDTTAEDFFYHDEDGQWIYNRNNKYNTTSTSGTIINLFQANNTLTAEIDIAAQGTVIRQNGGKIITDADRLINCSGYGDPDRNSDPHIGGEINAAARAGYTLSVADPVALYMHRFAVDNLYLDTSGNRDGTNTDPLPDEWLEVQRGSDLNGDIPLALRLKISNTTGARAPKKDDEAEGRLLDVSDIWDDRTKNNIRYGAQFADYIEIGVAAVVSTQGKVAEAQACWVRPPRKHKPVAKMMSMKTSSVVGDHDSSTEKAASPHSAFPLKTRY